LGFHGHFGGWRRPPDLLILQAGDDPVHVGTGSGNDRRGSKLDSLLSAVGVGVRTLR
jgi:hypothetical protein